MRSVADTIHINVRSRGELDERLESAVKQLQNVAAITRTHGILVTRHKPGSYTASLTDQVPYGITRENFN